MSDKPMAWPYKMAGVRNTMADYAAHAMMLAENLSRRQGISPEIAIQLKDIAFDISRIQLCLAVAGADVEVNS